ncbi:MAG: DUF84 family protein [Patescibacteria group bacterium]
MKIAIGTTSENKTAIVKAFFGDIKNFMIVPCDVSSGVTDQPLDEFTTREGAINRAKNAFEMTLETDIDFSLGLEGGLVLIDNTYFLLCVAVITDNSGVDIVGMSDTLPLPQYVSDQIANGKEFGVSIREFQESLIANIDDNIKNWIDELISRRSSFLMAIGSAYIQYLKLVVDRTKK